ncbi:MAG: maltose alpha-D-glucosyltransferase [Candidatus Marsarchaeota archaeon]|nr:maltose alpha-D-glucosyltransferase [Candidatus Marsarchaeota archaeon]
MAGENLNLWYRDAVFYELPVRSFYDSNGDGVGDFQGLRLKMGYLSDLGVDCIWLLPFYDSPLKDDGYDISDYYSVHPDYGTVDDFQECVEEAHKRGIRVIADLVMNHVSDQHPWFQEARKDRNSPRRDWFVWSDTDKEFQQARIIFTDTEKSNWTWDHVAKQYYWHRFYSSQPDLNYWNPDVRTEMMNVIRFWLKRGLDGFRCDAVPYLYEKEGTNCENLPETHQFFKEVRRMIDKEFPGTILLAEANQWPTEAKAYFGNEDEFHMAFNFPLMPRIFIAVAKEDRVPIVDIIKQTLPIPPTCDWGIFLRNHDELTLEMVTDEERDFMFKEYAKNPKMRLNMGIRRRLSPLLDNDRRLIELLHAILFSVPGSPILYYGDEIGMGDNIYLGDRNGVRTPMQWSPDRNAGFSKADPESLCNPVIVNPNYHYEAVNAEAESRLPTSLLNWVKSMIKIRKKYNTVLGRGEIEFFENVDRRALVFLKTFENNYMLCVYNLSRKPVALQLDLSRFAGWTPVEVQTESRFPPIGELPYFFTMSRHSFFWFKLEPDGSDGSDGSSGE